MVPGMLKTLRKINFGPYTNLLWQEWSLGDKFHQLARKVPQVYKMAKLVLGYSKIGI
jgi:hypothetical protein